MEKKFKTLAYVFPGECFIWGRECLFSYLAVINKCLLNLQNIETTPGTEEIVEGAECKCGIRVPVSIPAPPPLQSTTRSHPQPLPWEEPLSTGLCAPPEEKMRASKPDLHSGGPELEELRGYLRSTSIRCHCAPLSLLLPDSQAMLSRSLRE